MWDKLNVSRKIQMTKYRLERQQLSPIVRKGII